MAQNLPKASSLDLHGERGNWPGARIINGLRIGLRIEAGLHVGDRES